MNKRKALEESIDEVKKNPFFNMAVSVEMGIPRRDKCTGTVTALLYL